MSPTSHYFCTQKMATERSVDCRLLSQLIKLKHEEKALQVLDWIVVQPKLKREVSCTPSTRPVLHTQVIFIPTDINAIISNLTAFLLQRGFYFSSLMALLGKSSTLGTQQALRLHDRMRTQGVALDLVSYNIVINAAGKDKKRCSVLKHACLSPVPLWLCYGGGFHNAPTESNQGCFESREGRPLAAESRCLQRDASSRRET